MFDSATTPRLAEVAAWCRIQAKELSDSIRSVPAPFANFPFPQYGAICREALEYALTLGAAHLIAELGPTTMEGHASMADALRQALMLADWLATSGREQQQSHSSGQRTEQEGTSGEQYVTRDQISALVKRNKDTLADWLNNDAEAPEPAVEGGGGKRHEYLWHEVRPWLEKKTGRRLPERFPDLA